MKFNPNTKLPDAGLMMTHLWSGKHKGLRLISIIGGNPKDRNVVVHFTTRSDVPHSNAWDNKVSDKDMFALMDEMENESDFAYNKIKIPQFMRDVVKVAAKKDGKVFAWGMWERKPYDTWISPNARIVVMGDAAHPMCPYLGRGCNEACNDAMCLAKNLGRMEKNGIQNSKLLEKDGETPEKHATLRAALNAFETERKTIVEGLVSGAKLLGRRYTAFGLAGIWQRSIGMFGFAPMFLQIYGHRLRMINSNGEAKKMLGAVMVKVGDVGLALFDIGFKACELFNKVVGW